MKIINTGFAFEVQRFGLVMLDGCPDKMWKTVARFTTEEEARRYVYEETPVILEAWEDDFGAWVKVATYTRANAQRVINYPEYRAALTNAGFPVDVKIRICEEVTK